MPLGPCLDKVGPEFKDLTKRLRDRADDLMRSGMSEHDAGVQAILDEHKNINDKLDAVKRNNGFKTGKYEKPSGPYSTPTRALETIQAEHPDDTQLNRAAEFLKPVLKDDNTEITNAKLKPGYMGLAHPGGKIEVDFSQHLTNEDAHRTVVHELMHKATMGELETNRPFRAEVDKILSQVRKKLGLPDNDSTMRQGMQMLSNSGRDISAHYGFTNAHELLAEVYSNPLILDALKNIEAPGPEKINMLQKLFRAIVSAFNEKYKALQQVKGGISADNMADYLMQLTEQTVKKASEAKSEAAKIGDAERAAIVNMIRRAPDNMPDQTMKEIIMKHAKNATEDEVDQLIDQNRRDLRDDAAITPEEKVRQAKEIGKQTYAQAKRNPLMPKPDAVKAGSLAKKLRRWFGEGQDDVSAQKSIIRKNKGAEEQQIEAAYNDSKDLTDYWNKVPEDKQLGFIFATESPDDLQHESKEIRDMAADYRTRLDRVWGIIASIKGNLPYIEDYFPHFWEKPDEVKSYFAQIASKAPMEGNKSFLKKRFYATILDGYRKEYKLTTTNPEELVRLAEANAWKFQAAHGIISDMKAQGLLKYSVGNEIPSGWQTVDDPAFKRIAAILDKNDDPQMIKGSYYMPPDVAKLMNDYLSPGLRGNSAFKAIRQFNNIKNAYQLGLGLFHFGTTTIDNAISYNAVGLQKLSTGNLGGLIDLAKGSTVLPATLESVVKGIKTARDYKNNNITDDVQHLIDVNARIGKQKMYALDTWYNMKKASANIMKGEGTGKDFWNLAKNTIMFLPETINKPLMEHYVPALKIGSYLSGVKAEIAARPNMTPAELQTAKERTWDAVDDRLGQVVTDNQFISKAYKDLLFAGIRSAGWTGGTIKVAVKGLGEIPLSGKRLFKGQGITQRTAYMMALPMTVGFFGGMYHYLNTGNPPETLEDYFYPKDGTKEEDGSDHRVTLPTYMKDFISYVKHPGETLLHKTAPFVNDATELYQNKDFYGEQISNPDDPLLQRGMDVLKYELQSMVPFSFKTNKYSNTTLLDELTTKQGIEQKVGLMPAPKETQRTATENAINEESVKQNGRDAEGKTRAQVEQRVARMHLQQFIHDGGSWAEADPDLKAKAKVTEHGRKEFIKEARLDQYIRKFNHLTPERQVKLFNQMSDEEKEKFDPKGHIQKLADSLKND